MSKQGNWRSGSLLATLQPGKTWRQPTVSRITRLSGSGYYPWERVYHIHILNRMSNKAPPLTVHVTSKNHDLKEHTIGKGGDFQFHFRPNFWYNTVFNCVFKSGGKTKAFDIYKPGDYSYGSKICRLLKQRPVNWKVQDDGFYRSCDGENYQKMYDWGCP
ncbi:S-protein homolog 5-like [Hibiscus syriacus]|uniref:S-protein homolog 5-like n=1 Tax=Hibiscus syriacus TaxID=106335 RepID=UPI00192495B6|nr:S-protein homolog 5-like [Hibiscus syriacus]